MALDATNANKKTLTHIKLRIALFLHAAKMNVADFALHCNGFTVRKPEGSLLVL
jgi:hypothetical protein